MSLGLIFILFFLILLSFLVFIFIQFNKHSRITKAQKITASFFFILIIISIGISAILFDIGTSDENKEPINKPVTSQVIDNQPTENLQTEITQLINENDIQVGVSILDKVGKPLVKINDNDSFEMASTYKPLLATSLLNSLANNETALYNIYSEKAETYIK